MLTWTVRPARRGPERCGYRRFRCLRNDGVLPEVPTTQRKDRPSDLTGKPYLGERTVPATDGHHRLSRAHDSEISRLPHARRHRVCKVRIGRRTVLVRQDTDGRTTRFRSTAGRSLHHPAPPTTDHDAATLRDEPPDLAGQRVSLVVRLPGADNRYVWPIYS